MDSYLSESEIAVDTELHGLRLYRDEVVWFKYVMIKITFFD